jgi:hypothetical protein
MHSSSVVYMPEGGSVTVNADCANLPERYGSNPLPAGMC